MQLKKKKKECEIKRQLKKKRKKKKFLPNFLRTIVERKLANPSKMTHSHG